MEKRIITKEDVEHTKKILELYEEQEIEECQKCEYFKSWTTIGYHDDHNNERCKIKDTSYKCKHPSVMKDEYDHIGKHLYDRISLQKNDKTRPEWCPKRA